MPPIIPSSACTTLVSSSRGWVNFSSFHDEGSYEHNRMAGRLGLEPRGGEAVRFTAKLSKEATRIFIVGQYTPPRKEFVSGARLRGNLSHGWRDEPYPAIFHTIASYFHPHLTRS